MACDGELEFEAPLARFDVEEWTEFYEENGSPAAPAAVCNGDRRHCRLTADCGELIGASSAMRLTATPTRELSSGSSCGSGNFAEQFGETCLSGSLEDLVNSFDESVTKCCKNYEERVEQLAPVQVRTEDDLVEDCQ